MAFKFWRWNRPMPQKSAMPIEAPRTTTITPVAIEKPQVQPWDAESAQQRYKRWAEQYKAGKSLATIARENTPPMSAPGVRYGITAYYGVSSIRQVNEVLGRTSKPGGRPRGQESPQQAINTFTERERTYQEVSARVQAAETWGERRALFREVGGGTSSESYLTVAQLADIFGVSEACISLWRKAIREGKFRTDDKAPLPKNTLARKSFIAAQDMREMAAPPSTPAASTTPRRWTFAERQAAEQKLQARIATIHSYQELRRVFQEVAGGDLEATPLTAERIMVLFDMGRRTYYKWRAEVKAGTFHTNESAGRFNKLAAKYEKKEAPPTQASVAAQAADTALAELTTAAMKYKHAMEQVARRGQLWEQPVYQRRAANTGSVMAQTTSWLIRLFEERQTQPASQQEDKED